MALVFVSNKKLKKVREELEHINHKLDVLITATISPEQLIALTQNADQLQNTSDMLQSAIERNK